MLGRMEDKQTLISSSMDCRFVLFLHWILVRVENPNSLRYDVENCSKMAKAFLAIDWYYSLIKIQNFSRLDSLYLILKLPSVDIDASSSSSVSVKLTRASSEISMNGFPIQSYFSVLSDGK